MNFEPAGIAGGDGLQRRPAALVALDGYRPLASFQEQRAREAAGTGPYLHHRAARQRCRRPGDAARDVEVEDEMLAERLSRGQLQAPHNLTQWREAVGTLAHALLDARDLARWCANLAASCRAAMKLVGRALPVPARAKAVPWSGDVRTKGSPSVTLTPRSKARVLSGISAWSWYMATTAS